MTQPFTTVGLLHHPKKPDSLTLAGQMAEFLRARGRAVWSGSAWDEPEALANVAGLDLLITLGGDGTMLRAARMGSRYGVPILGIKLGRVSFLADVLPDHWREPLTRLLDGDYWLEERMLLDVAVDRGGEPPVNHSYLALNDVVISRGSLARLINVETWVDQSYLTNYRSDGVIVATPTGCTGYAMAAGGPILPPELKNILLLPICPHLSLNRAVVLSQGATVSLRVEADYPAILTVDGQFEITLAEDDRIEVRASQHVSNFVHMQDRAYFYRTLMERLRWAG
ncbi:MAG: NAD(+) kinase [Chloroflexi bacterium HGW-Chloroflexi-1]|nr:MAG: NAD(+) kinase [Chloroflexi bacterium HGW-Chloroflexi-1]